MTPHDTLAEALGRLHNEALLNQGDPMADDILALIGVAEAALDYVRANPTVSPVALRAALAALRADRSGAL